MEANVYEFATSYNISSKHLDKAKESATDIGVKLAIMIEPDGGMPGGSIEDRILASIIVLLYFLQEEKTMRAFRPHVEKLTTFLKNIMGQCDEDKKQYIIRILKDMKNSPLPSYNMDRYISKIEKRKFRYTDDIWDKVVNIR